MQLLNIRKDNVHKRVTSDFKKIIQDWIEWHKGDSDGIVQSTRNGQNWGEGFENQM